VKQLRLLDYFHQRPLREEYLLCWALMSFDVPILEKIPLLLELAYPPEGNMYPEFVNSKNVEWDWLWAEMVLLSARNVAEANDAETIRKLREEAFKPIFRGSQFVTREQFEQRATQEAQFIFYANSLGAWLQDKALVFLKYVEIVYEGSEDKPQLQKQSSEVVTSSQNLVDQRVEDEVMSDIPSPKFQPHVNPEAAQ
jgi:hypothetical protein